MASFSAKLTKLFQDVRNSKSSTRFGQLTAIKVFTLAAKEKLSMQDIHEQTKVPLPTLYLTYSAIRDKYGEAFAYFMPKLQKRTRYISLEQLRAAQQSVL